MSLALRTERDHAATPAAFEHLAEGLERELELVNELRTLLAGQRAAIAACDAAAVQQSCDRVAHTLQAMDSARRARLAALEALGVPADTPLSDLPGQLGGAMPPRVESARLALREAASLTADDAAVHHQVLRRTVESGEAYLQALFSSATEPEPVYRTGERAGDHQSGFLLDRKA